MRLVKTQSHTSDRQGYEAGKIRKKRKEGLALRNRNNRQRKPSPYHPQGERGEKVSTEKLKVSIKT